MSLPFLTAIDRRINRYIGLSDLNPALEAQIRAEQIGSVLRLTPAMMGGNIVIALLVTSQYLQHSRFPYVLAWAAAILIMASLAVQAWFAQRHDGPRPQASKHAVHRAVTNAALLGVLWGLLPVITLFDDPGTPLRGMIGVIVAGMICGGAFSLAAIPMAAIAFTIPIFIGSIVILLQSFMLADQAIAILLVLYSAILANASLSTARVFVGRLIAISESNERGAVIAMLLKEFEDHASDWLWSTDAKGQFVDISDRFSAAAAKHAADLCDMTFLDLFRESGADGQPGYRVIVDHMRSREAFSEIELPVIAGSDRHWWRFSAQPLLEESGEFAGYRGVASDVTEQKNAKDRVAYLAHHDDLTGLANRANFAEKLCEAIVQLERFDIGFALLMIDLDQFKAVNDTRGHEIGDQLLVQVARRFASAVGKGDIIARLGGDEFAVIQTNPPDEADTANLANTLIDAARVPIDIAGQPVSVGASVGVAFAPKHGTRSDQLLRHADLALFRAKQGGRNTYRVFQIEMDRRAQERRVLERQVSQALETNQFVLNYQPLIDVESNQIAGFEALVRWNHPDRGLVAPDDFIPVAERTGAIKAIGDWVLREACKTAATWPEDLTISVNLSARQFENGRIIGSVTEALEQSAIDPKKLEIEITESVLIDQPDDAIDMLKQLKAIGVSIAIDDFGTGYSSLSYLWKFPFDKIKLDKTFVAAIENDKVACDILRIIGSLGETLNMRITAEGVENIEQAEFLRSIACHQLQGFYFSKPLGSDELPAFLVENLTGKMQGKAGKELPGRKVVNDI